MGAVKPTAHVPPLAVRFSPVQVVSKYREKWACFAHFGVRRGGISLQSRLRGGEGGIRTLGTGVSPYNGLANRRIRPLCHLSATISDSLPRCSRLQAEPFNAVGVLWLSL